MIPKMVRFSDLEARGIVSSWQHLGNLILDHGFPPGRYLGARVRSWTEDEIAEWLASRPQGKAIKKRKSATKRKEADYASAS